MGIDAKMLVKVPRNIGADEVRRKSIHLQVIFTGDILFVIPPGQSAASEGRHALEIVDEYWQDGPSLHPKSGETFIEVHLFTRYYGPGYERGDIVNILAVARAVRTMFSPCEVWYGGDSSGVCAELLDERKEAALWAHFLSEHGRDYFGNRGLDWTGAGGAVHCDFCDLPATANMSGGDKTGHYCLSCGRHWVRYGDGRIVLADKDYKPLQESIS